MRDRRPPADKLLIELTVAQVDAISQMVALGYGDGTPSSVVEFALERFIDDLRRARIIAPPAASVKN